ncbi:MAG: DNA primase [Nitrospirae bacterium]|nr:DNA primase [Nitrospirota bacterium]
MPSFNNDLEEIKNRLDIVDVISEYIPLKKAGQNHKGLCPFHTEKTPSFLVSPSKQIYHCFGCGNGGDVFTFLTQYENISFQEAVEILAKRAGVVLKKPRKDAVDTQEKETILNLNKDVLVFYQKALHQTSEALEYLKKRGITGEALGIFSLGYAPQKRDALFSYLKNKGYKAETIKKVGLINYGNSGYYDTFRHRIIFPIFDLRGEVIAFGGRVISTEDEPKYLNSPETAVFNKSRALYGLNIAKESIKKLGNTILVEGYFDAITSHMYGFSNTVAPLGTAITEGHGKLIKRFTRDVLLMFDGDDAGIKAAQNGIGILLENGLNVEALPLPQGEDPDSFLRKNGKEAFDNLLKKTMSIVDFFMMQKGDKLLIAHNALEVISKISDSILKGYYVKLLSEKLEINEVFLREELRKIKTKTAYTHRQKQRMECAIKITPREERYILQILLNFPEKAEQIFTSVSVEDFEDPIIKSIFRKIKEGAVDYNILISDADEDEKNLLTELLLKVDFDNPQKILEDCINRLRSKKRRILLQKLHDRIKEAELKKDITLLKALQLEQQSLLRL